MSFTRSALKQSPAIVIATAALFLSLGTGIGYAASTLSGSAIAPHSIPGNRIVDHSITAAQLAPRTVKVTRLQLLHGWKSSESSYATGNPEVVTNGTGIAWLAGSLHGGTSELAFVLPKGDRPSHNLYINAYTFDGTTGSMEIAVNGDVELFSGSVKDYTSLASISFPIGQ